VSFEISSEDAALSTELQLSLNFALSGLSPVSDIAHFHRLKLKAGLFYNHSARLQEEIKTLCSFAIISPLTLMQLNKRFLLYVVLRKYFIVVTRV